MDGTGTAATRSHDIPHSDLPQDRRDLAVTQQLPHCQQPHGLSAPLVDTGGCTTLQGSQLDFLLVSNSLQSAVRLEACWDVPWRPHCALQVYLDCDQPAQEVQQLQRFPPIGHTFQLPHQWTSFQEDNCPFYIMNDLITGLGSDLARWATQTEKYITQMLHKPTLGRGSNIKLTTAPLVDASTSRKWLRGSVAFWEKLNVRLM